MNVWFCAGWKQLVCKKNSPHLVWPERQLWNLGICRNTDLKIRSRSQNFQFWRLEIISLRFLDTIFIFLVYPIIPPPMCHVDKVVFFKLKWTNTQWVLEIEIIWKIILWTSCIKLFLINIPFLALLPVYLKIATFVSLSYIILVLSLYLSLHLYVWTLPISNIHLKEGKTISCLHIGS